MNNTIIEMQAVTKVYDRKEVLHQLDLKIERGTIYGLLGINGAGKTTTFKLLAGLLPPTAGEIRFDGQPIAQKSKTFLRDMGILIETPVFYDHLSAQENLELHLEYMGCSCSQVRDALAAVGLGDTGRQPVSKFSMGMKQRLGVAAAFMERPDAILLDEPTNALDPLGREMVRSLIGTARERGASLVIACHDEAFLNDVSDRVLALCEGRIMSISQEMSDD